MGKKLNRGYYIVLIIVLVIAYFSFKDIYTKSKIKNDGREIVVQFTSKQELPKRTYFYFTYFINNKKVETANSGIKYSITNSDKETKDIDSLKINRFYLAKYLPEYDDIIIVDPTKQITDTTRIFAAGFSKSDID